MENKESELKINPEAISELDVPTENKIKEAKKESRKKIALKKAKSKAQRMWRKGFDTREIAVALGRSIHTIYNWTQRVCENSRDTNPSEKFKSGLEIKGSKKSKYRQKVRAFKSMVVKKENLHLQNAKNLFQDGAIKDSSTLLANKEGEIWILSPEGYQLKMPIQHGDSIYKYFFKSGLC